MVHHIGIRAELAVVYHSPVTLYQRHPKPCEAMALHVDIECVLVDAVGVVHPFAHALVVVLQPYVEHVSLISVLMRLLENDERYGEKQEY